MAKTFSDILGDLDSIHDEEIEEAKEEGREEMRDELKERFDKIEIFSTDTAESMVDKIADIF